MEYMLLVLSAILVNNILLAQFLGNCPFLGVSQKMGTATGMAMAVIFVLTLAGAITWMVQWYLLVPFELDYLQTIAFILVIAALVQFVEIVLQKTAPALYQALGIFLPLITTNCAILGLALFMTNRGYTGWYGLLQGLVFALGAGGGFTLALVLMAGLRQEAELSDIPSVMRGTAMNLIIAGILSLAFMGFAGLFSPT